MYLDRNKDIVGGVEQMEARRPEYAPEVAGSNPAPAPIVPLGLLLRHPQIAKRLAIVGARLFGLAA